jgi:hypothetical protein
MGPHVCLEPAVKYISRLRGVKPAFGVQTELRNQYSPLNRLDEGMGINNCAGGEVCAKTVRILPSTDNYGMYWPTDFSLQSNQPVERFITNLRASVARLKFQANHADLLVGRQQFLPISPLLLVQSV